MTDNDMTGKAKGGHARALALSPEERKGIAQRAAAVRWDKAFAASHKGNFEKEFGIDIDCYVLDDANKTAVISQSGMAKALGLSPRGNAFPRFLESRAMSSPAGAEIREKFNKPIKFQWGAGGAEQPPATIHGFDVALLIDVCNAIAAAEAQGRLAPNQKLLAQQAAIITGACAKNGIKHLAYALAGYNPTSEEIIASFRLYVQEEARKYEREFPNDLYLHWHRLYDIPINGGRGRPWYFRYLTVKHIYFPIAKSNGRILELLRALKSKDGDRLKKLFQFLSVIGARALSQHLGRVQEMAESSKTRHEYETKIIDRFGGQTELDLVMPDSPNA